MLVSTPKYPKDAASRMTQAQVDEILAEKEEEIRDLRSEGESLSKQVSRESQSLISPCFISQEIL